MHGIIDRLLNPYRQESFIIQLKAKFILYSYFVVIPGILLAGFGVVFANLNNPLHDYSIDYNLIILLSVGLLVNIGGLFVFRNGHYKAAGHLLLITGFTLIWSVIFINQTLPLSRLDTFLYAVALLSVVPLIITQRARTIFFYALGNLLTLFFFMLVFPHQMNLETFSIISFLFAGSISILIIAIISWQIFSINKQALDKAEDDLEQRKIAEKALKESELFRKRVFESSPIPIVVMDVESNRFIDCNPAAVKAYGFSSYEETLTKTPIDISAPIQYDGKPSAEKIKTITAYAHKKGSLVFEWRHQRPDGTIWDAEVNLLSFRVKEREMLQFSLVDITERKRIAQSIAQSEKRAQMQKDTIASLATDKSLAEKDLISAFDSITRAVSETAGVESASIWLFNEDLSLLQCISNYQRSSKTHISRQPLKARDYPMYFKAITTESRIDANHAQTDIRTQEFTSNYLIPNGITSMLDAGISSENKLLGVVCLEHAGNPRIWQPDEEAFASTVAAIVSQIIANQERKMAEEALILAKEKAERGEEKLQTMYSELKIAEEEARATNEELRSTSEALAQNIQELELANEKYRLLGENVPGVIYLCNYQPEWEMVYVNDQVEQLTGYKKEEFLNQSVRFATICHPDDHSHTTEVIASTLDLGKPFHIQYRIKHKNGEWRWVDEYGVGIKREGKFMWIEGFIADITVKKKTELELQQYQNHLEKLVDERTLELAATNKELKESNEELVAQRETLEKTLNDLKVTQDQLIQAEKMASLGILTAGVAHEINNPLNYIYNGTVAIESFILDHYTKEAEEIMPLFEAINKGVKRISEIIKSMNKYSRSEKLPHSLCNLQEIIDDCLIMLFNKYKNRIEIVKKYPEKPSLTIANEGQLHQAFLNIIANAVQAITDKGKITIEIENKNNEFIIVVADTGAGIAEENLRHVFDPFFTTKDPGEGTGLGLAITKRIINDHQGIITCTSSLNKGTQFLIQLPLRAS